MGTLENAPCKFEYLAYSRSKKSADKKTKSKSAKPKPDKQPVIGTGGSSSDVSSLSELTPRPPAKQRTFKAPGQKLKGSALTEDQALHFRNDSGTQINFWGQPPAAVRCLA